MKHLLITLLVLLLGTLSVLAQDNANLITLNDATPAIDAVITLPPDTTGAVSLEIANAAVKMTDANNAVVFYAADPRIHAIELNIAPNTGAHTLTVERLPGMSQAYVRLKSLPELNVSGTVTLTNGTAISLNQEVYLPLDANAPGGTTSVSIPNNTVGVVTAVFLGAHATTQLVDDSGVVIAQSTDGHIDGVSYALDGGRYAFTLVGRGLTKPIVTSVRAVSAEEVGVTVLEVPTQPPSLVATPTANTTASTTAMACNAVVQRSSVNLRSGPGTAYSVLGYGYYNESYLVGGRNPENNWIVVSTDNGSAWMALSNASLQGACENLTVFNVPLRNMDAAQVTVIRNDDKKDDKKRNKDDDHDDDDDD